LASARGLIAVRIFVMFVVIFFVVFIVMFVVMFMVIVEWQFAGMLLLGRFLGGGCHVVTRLRGSISRPMNRIRRVEALLHVPFEVVERKALSQVIARPSKFGEAPTDRSREFGHAFRAKDQKGHDENHHEF
jgi:hypothetical protein